MDSVPGFVLSNDSVDGGDMRSPSMITEVDSVRSKLLLTSDIVCPVDEAAAVVVHDASTEVDIRFASSALLLVLFAFVNKA